MSLTMVCLSPIWHHPSLSSPPDIDLCKTLTQPALPVSQDQAARDNSTVDATDGRAEIEADHMDARLLLAQGNSRSGGGRFQRRQVEQLAPKMGSAVMLRIVPSLYGRTNRVVVPIFGVSWWSNWCVCGL